jgi:hypothetical protein
MPTGEFAVVMWDYGPGGDQKAIDAALLQAIPNRAIEFACCLTVPSTENAFRKIVQSLQAIPQQHPTFSFSAIWVDDTVRNVFHHAGQ